MAEVIDISIEHNPSPKDVVVDFTSGHSPITVVNPDANAKTGQAADAKATYEALNMKANKADIPSIDLSGYAKKDDVDSSLSKKADKSELDNYAETSYVNDKLRGKQDALTAGSNITILNGVISATGGSGSSIELSKPSADGAGKAADAKETYLALEKKLDNGTGTNVVIGQSASSDPDKNNVAVGALATIGSTEGRGVAVGYGATVTDGERVIAIGAGVSAGNDTPIVIGSRDDSRIIVRKDGTMTVGGKALAVRESVNSALGNKVDVSVFDSTISGVNNNVGKLREDVGEFSADVSAELTEVKATIANNAGSVDAALRLKQNKLTAGTNIMIVDNVISATGTLSGKTDLLVNADESKRVSVELIAETDKGESPVIELRQSLFDLGGTWERVGLSASMRLEPLGYNDDHGCYEYKVCFDASYNDGTLREFIDLKQWSSTPRPVILQDMDLVRLREQLLGIEYDVLGTVQSVELVDENAMIIKFSTGNVAMEYCSLSVTFNVTNDTETVVEKARIVTDKNYNSIIGKQVVIGEGTSVEDAFWTGGVEGALHLVYNENKFIGAYEFKKHKSVTGSAATAVEYYTNWETVFEPSAVSTSMIEISHADLISLRDNNQLVPGIQYRIIDYVATVGEWFYTSDPHGMGRDVAVSSGHAFDVVVTATGSNTLDEVARALRHDGDTYFPENTKFEAWKIWYCIDNDVNRFLWADEENGKGVIYRMIDEFNNDVPYDFKSILSIPAAASGKYATPIFIFSSEYNSNDGDESLQGTVYNNIIPSTYFTGEVEVYNAETEELEILELRRTQKLNLIHIIGDSCHDNVFSVGCEKNVISGSCNHFGEYCLNNYVNGSYNRLGNDCANNRLGATCSSNTFGNSCYNNTLEGSDIRCSFGNGASENTIPSYCRALTLQNDVRSMELVLPSGTDYYRNAEFKSGLRDVTIEDTREDNTHGYKVFKPQNSEEFSVPYTPS